MTFDLNAIMVGDSIVDRSKSYILALRPTWKIDAVPGRSVTAAPDVIRANLDLWGTPRRLIIALGQNDDPEWTKADYRALVDLAPATTRVFFVTTWKDAPPKTVEEAATQALYSKWMRAIAVAQPNVDIIDWRQACKDAIDPETGLCVLLDDGSHPTNPAGRCVYANLVVDAVTALD